MTDVFLSYASDDRDRVRGLVTLLEDQGWSVWWDRSLNPGQAWDDEIQKQADAAKCMVVVWTNASVASRWVKTEALEGLEKDILLPVQLDEVEIPISFRRTHTANLVGWPEREGDQLSLLAAVKGFVEADVGVPDGDQSTATPLEIHRPSILVLPFVNISKDPDDEFLADGMTEDVITLLSHDPSCKVMARNTSFSYKGLSPDVRQLNATLGVDYVVEGSVRSFGERIRITGQLIDASSRSHIWSDQYDCKRIEIFDVQDDVERSIANALGTRVRQAHRDRVRRMPPDKLDAWGLLTKAAMLGDTTGRALREQLEIIEQALSLDPEYALAHARKAFVLSQAHLADTWEDDDLATAVIEAAERAMRKSPLDPEVLSNCAYAFSWCGGRERGVTLAHRAVELAPVPEYKAALVTVLLNVGDVQKAIDLGEEIWPDLPRDTFVGAILAQGYNITGDYKKAIEWSRRSIDESPDRYDSWLYLANALVKTGSMDQAKRALDNAKRLARIDLGRFRTIFQRIYVSSEMVDRLTDGLEQLDF